MIERLLTIELKSEYLLVLGQQTKLQALAYTAYKDWIRQMDSDVQSFKKIGYFL